MRIEKETRINFRRRAIYILNAIYSVTGWACGLGEKLITMEFFFQGLQTIRSLKVFFVKKELMKFVARLCSSHRKKWIGARTLVNIQIFSLSSVKWCLKFPEQNSKRDVTLMRYHGWWCCRTMIWRIDDNFDN